MQDFQVGEWRVHPSLNRLSRNGDEVRVEPKVMQVLEVLAETPGEVVTRDALVARVWPDVFVSDDVLHRAIRELRRIFGDDSANPSYIETIRKRGYRLIAPVQKAAAAAASVAAAPLPAVAVPASLPAPRRSGLVMAVASVALAAVLGAVVYALASRPAVSTAGAGTVRFEAMTSAQVNETDPALSPDGTRLAFAMRPDYDDTREAANADLYITEGAGRSPERVVAHPADDRYPSWTFDASMLAFIRMDERACSVMVMTLRDRRERRVAACGNPEEPRVTWSADGEWLIESYAPGPDPVRGWQIARVSASAGVREELTLPNPGTLGDHSPSVSPDGTRIAFVRGLNGATADLHVMPSGGGPPVRVTWDNQDVIGVDWSPDGRSLYYATDRAGGYTIWRVPVEGGTPELVVGGAAKLKHPSVARLTGKMAYESWSYEINLWEAPIADRLDLEGELTSTLRPTVRTFDQWNHSPDLSPDGKRVAFISTRSGGAELWVADRDGANAAQFTTFGRAAFRQPRWSPDGTRILASVSVNGRLDLYIVDAASRALTQLTDDEDDELAPAWSHDGASVLFGQRRSGMWQVMRLSLADRSRTQLTTSGGYAPQASPDGASILFTRLEQTGIWAMPAAGGEPRLLVPGVRAAETANWRVTPSGIYHVGTTGPHVVVRRAPLTGGAGADVAWIGNYSWPGFAVTPDGSHVVYAHWDRRDSNIMSVHGR